MRPLFHSAIEDTEDLVLMVAAADEGVAGGLMADFRRPDVASLGMLLLGEWWGRRAGSALMAERISWCRDHAPLLWT